MDIYKALQNNKGVHIDHDVFWRTDGTSFPVEYWSYPILKDNAIVGAVVTFIDISERRGGEEALRLNEERLEALLSLHTLKTASENELCLISLSSCAQGSVN